MQTLYNFHVIKRALNNPKFSIFTLVFLSFMLYSLRLIGGNVFKGDIIGSTTHWGSLTEDLLIQYPVKAIWNMHSQPPLLNIIYAIAYLSYPNQVLFVQVLWFCLAALIPILLFCSLRLMNISKNMSFAFACLYCFYPNTIGYSFSGYNTILVQFCFAYFIFSFLKLIDSRFKTIAPICLSLVALFLVRAPFLGIAVIAMLLLVYSLHFRRYRFVLKSLIAVIVSLTLVFILQLHYIKDFNQLTNSSLGGFSTLRLLKVGMPEQDYSKLATNDCEALLLNEADSGDSVNQFLPCQAEASLLRFNLDKISESGNPINSLGSLKAAILVRDLALKGLIESPYSLLKSVLGNDARPGSLHYFLSVKTLGDRPLRMFFDNLPFFASLFALLYYIFHQVTFTLLKPNSRRLTNPKSSSVILFVGLLFGYTLFYSLATELFENDRYKHEAYPIYFFLVGAIVGQLLSYSRNLYRD